MAPRFVIVGTGRSGTKYISEVLTRAGIRCGHEEYWTTWRTPDETLVGDSSCNALPQGLDGYGGIVFHQVRHPLDVCASLVRNRIVDPHLTLFRRLTDHDPTDPLGFAMAVWLAFAGEAERLRPSLYWQVERVDAALIYWIGDRVKCPAVNVDAALEMVPRTANRHYDDRDPLLWDDVYDHDPELAAQLRDKALTYGYDERSPV